jgi:tetratricopeptide (TPR) repeat protein
MAQGKFASQNITQHAINHVFKLGERHFENGKYNDAINAFNSVIRHQPNNINALKYLGKAYLKSDHLSKALSSFKQILEKTPNDSSAKQSYAEIWDKIIALAKHHFDNGDYRTAIEVINGGLDIDNNELKAHILKGLSHWKLFEDEDDVDAAIESFLHVLKHEPANQQVKQYLVDLYLDYGRECLLHQNQYKAKQAFKEALKLSPELSIARELEESCHIENESIARPYVFNDVYLVQFKDIQDKHKRISQMNNIQKAEWVVELIGFINRYYKNKSRPYAFTNTELFAKTEQGKELRQQGFGRFLLKNYPSMMESLVDPQLFDQCCLSHLEDGVDDIYFSDLFSVLRMVFETIHQLPRQDRDQANKKLPWGDSSWYYLEFLGSLYSMEFEGQKKYAVEICGDQHHIESLTQFQKSIANYMCLVKIASLHILDEDLAILDEFFQSFAANLKNPNVELNKLRDLPNLPILINYFKESFSLYRIISFMPDSITPRRLQYISDYNGPDTYESTPYLKFQKNNITPTGNGLKGKFAFLRQVACIGELFTHRSYGPDLDSIQFFSPIILQNIRNGFAHIEELQSANILFLLEKDDVRLAKLFHEFVKLRERVITHISDRQTQYPLWPETNQGFHKWQQAVNAYWQQITRVYNAERDLFNEQTFAPMQPILLQKEIVDVLSMIKQTDAESVEFKKNLEKELKGELRPSFKELSQHVYQRYVKDEQKNKGNQKWLQIQLTKAYKKYNDLRVERKNQIIQERKNKEIELIKCQETETNRFPTIKQLSTEFSKQLTNRQNKMSTQQLFVNLNLRLKNLNELLEESNIVFDPTKPLSSQLKCYEQFKKLLNDDIQFFLACCYLMTQIISILNHFSTSKLIPVLIPDSNRDLDHWFALMGRLKLRLIDWVPLRNMMMHSDSIIESEELFAFQIHFHKLPEALSQVIIELLFNFMPQIKTMSPRPLGNIVLDKDNHVRQHEPLNFRHIKSIFELMLLKEQYQQGLRFYRQIEEQPESHGMHVDFDSLGSR